MLQKQLSESSGASSEEVNAIKAAHQRDMEKLQRTV
jgi:hypothetical protein